MRKMISAEKNKERIHRKSRRAEYKTRTSQFSSFVFSDFFKDAAIICFTFLFVFFGLCKVFYPAEVNNVFIGAGSFKSETHKTQNRESVSPQSFKKLLSKNGYSVTSLKSDEILPKLKPNKVVKAYTAKKDSVYIVYLLYNSGKNAKYAYNAYKNTYDLVLVNPVSEYAEYIKIRKINVYGNDTGKIGKLKHIKITETEKPKEGTPYTVKSDSDGVYTEILKKGNSVILAVDTGSNTSEHIEKIINKL